MQKAVDTDVLFAAACLHDMAAFMPCADEKMEHGECAVRQSDSPRRGISDEEVFFGYIGAARMIALTGDKAAPPALVTVAARPIGERNGPPAKARQAR